MPVIAVGQGISATRLHYEREGTGEPLLWITGFAISSEIFAPVIRYYSGDHDCIRYDNRGAGRSHAPWRLTSMPELAADAVRLLDALNIDSAHVYGLSMGGMVAQEMAIRFPDRVRGLVLGATSHGGPRAKLASPKILVALASRSAPAAVRVNLVAKALFTEDFRSSNPELVLTYLGLLGAHRASARGLASHWWASLYHETFEQLAQIQAPTLILHGAQDHLTPVGNARTLAAGIPDSTLVVLPDAAHAYLLEQPEKSHQAFSSWLADRSPISAGRPLTGLAARTEPVTRQFGLQVGAMRAARTLTDLARTGRPR